MSLKGTKITHITDNKISVTTFATDSKVTPAKYEAGFKKVNSKSANQPVAASGIKTRKYV